MPFIEIRNWPEDWIGPHEQGQLVIELRKAVFLAEVPGITEPGQITVTFGGSRIPALNNETVGVICDFLFEQPARTKEVLDRLADQLHAAVEVYFDRAAQARTGKDWQIEVIVRTFNTETGAYRVG